MAGDLRWSGLGRKPPSNWPRLAPGEQRRVCRGAGIKVGPARGAFDELGPVFQQGRHAREFRRGGAFGAPANPGSVFRFSPGLRVVAVNLSRQGCRSKEKNRCRCWRRTKTGWGSEVSGAARPRTVGRNWPAEFQIIFVSGWGSKVSKEDPLA